VTIVGSIASILQRTQTLGLSAGQIGMAASGYLAGAVTGALIFGYLTDRLGRKKLFMVTLLVYTVFTVCTALSWNFMAFFAFRFLTGLGIGGEYAAINSAIDELIPARRRGQVDLSINSSWWLGTIVASVVTLSLLNLLPVSLGWRLVFGMGAVLALAVMLVRRYLPESPRWLLTHGRAEEAERTVEAIEAEVTRQKGALPPVTGGAVTIDQLRRVSFGEVLKTMFREYPRRTALALSLMVTQAFLYNAVFFTEALVLTTFFGVSATTVPIYIIPLAVGNLIGPWLLGRYFDTIGRRAMIGGTYIVSGVLLVVTGMLFEAHALDATTMTLCWGAIFFFASAGASAAYLTGSEIFPLEARALAIAFVYAIGTLAGGVAAPYVFGLLIQSQSVNNVVYGYLFGAALMILGGLTELVLGVNAEGKALEDIAAPITMVGRHKVGVPPVREGRLSGS
jgi:MFS family permease